MKIAMVAPFDISNPKSWSGTPLSLYSSLKNYNQEIVNLNLSEYYNFDDIKKNSLKYLDLIKTLKKRQITSKLGPAVMNPLNSKTLNDICQKEDFDCLIEFGGFLPGKDVPPYYIYTDASHDLSLDFYKETGNLPYNNSFSIDEMKRAADYARPIYQNAAGVFCMSDFLAKSMINTTKVDERKVHTVYAGANWHDVNLPVVKPKSISGKSVFDILIVGVDYFGKGYDILIDAVNLLNQTSSQKFKLHLCGVNAESKSSEYIINHGFVNKNQLISLLETSDLFVLPSRFDCFGIAFVEAMTFGLPCIGRKLCAMPEIIDEGINGELITDDDSKKLSETIYKICSNEELYQRYSKNAIEKSKMFTWENVSHRIMSVINRDMNNFSDRK